LSSKLVRRKEGYHYHHRKGIPGVLKKALRSKIAGNQQPDLFSR